MMDFEKEQTHESFGNIRIGRVSGRKKLHGSNLDYGAYFSIQISRASRIHEYGQDWSFKKDELIEVDITPMQFMELITSTNGSGVPCTINYVMGKKMENVPDDNQTESQLAKDYFKERIDGLSETVNKLLEESNELLARKSFTKKNIAEINSNVKKIHQEINSNIPFYLQQFERTTEKMVGQAKIEVESFANMIIKEAGIEAISNGVMPKISFKNSEE